jgi:hypothetical protein
VEAAAAGPTCGTAGETMASCIRDAATAKHRREAACDRQSGMGVAGGALPLPSSCAKSNEVHRK